MTRSVETTARVERRCGRRLRAAMACMVTAGLVAGWGTESLAGESSAALHLTAQVRPRVLVEPGRHVVTLEPGRSVVVPVTVKARLAEGSAVLVTLETRGGATPVFYRTAEARGVLAGQTVVGVLRRSGIHDLEVVLALAPTASRSVTVPLAFRAEISGGMVAAGARGDTRGAP